MKRYGNNQKKSQSVVDYLMWSQDRRHAVNQICQHNMQEGTVKLHLTGNTIYHQSSKGYTPVSMHYDSSMEMNALKAINMFTSTKPNSLYPSLMQIYTVRRADERAILQNPENLNREVFLTRDLKTKLLKYKRESIDKYEKDPYWPSDPNYYKIVNKEYAEIQWLETFAGTQNDFFNSEYIKGFGLIFQYNPQPNEEEEAMLQELMKQLELMKQEQIKITRALETKDRELETKDRLIGEREQLILDQNEQIVELTNCVSTKDTTINHLKNELSIKDETIDEKDGIINNLNNDLLDKNDQINTLNATIHDLHEAHVDQTPQINDLTHKLEIATIKKEASEQQVALLTRENARLGRAEEELRLDKAELREANKVVNEEKIALKQFKDLLEVKVNDLSTKMEEKKLFVDQVKVHYDEYETLMLGCDKCNQYVHHNFDWPTD